MPCHCVESGRDRCICTLRNDLKGVRSSAQTSRRITGTIGGERAVSFGRGYLLFYNIVSKDLSLPEVAHACRIERGSRQRPFRFKVTQ